MADERRANGRRFGRRRKSRSEKNTAGANGSLEPNAGALPSTPAAECPICQKPIYDLSSALADKENGAPVHFDCALRHVSEQETLAPGEKLVYIGSGAFAVVEYVDRSETAFTIKRRLLFEEEGKKQDWRKALSSRVSNL